MKKTLFRFAAMLMIGAFALAACEKQPQKEDNSDKENQKEGEEVVKSTIEINIDGDFSDWDQITADVAGKDEYVAMLKASASDAIPVIKTASDNKNVYFYAEIQAAALPQNSICAEWGDSRNGADGFRGDEDNDAISTSTPPFNLFFDPDGKENTGFFTYPDGDEPAIPGLGCEMCAQNMMFFNPVSKTLGIAWNQVNIGPEKYIDAAGNLVDYDYNGDFFQQDEWNAAGTVPQYGWQNTGAGEGDNIAPRPENIKAVP